MALLATTLLILPAKATAATPQDTYNWTKNIGTAGCPDPNGQKILDPTFLEVKDDTVYVSDSLINTTVSTFGLDGKYQS